MNWVFICDEWYSPEENTTFQRLSVSNRVDRQLQVSVRMPVDKALMVSALNTLARDLDAVGVVPRRHEALGEVTAK